MYLVFVCGGRDYRDRHVMWKMLDELRDQHQDMWILNGGAKGADNSATWWAIERNDKRYVQMNAEWKKYGRSAGMIRNEEMLQEMLQHREMYGDASVQALAFWDGESRGTRDMIGRLEDANVQTSVVRY